MIKGVNLRMNATNKGGPAMASFSKGLKGIKKSQDAVRRSNVGFMKGMNANRRIIQQVGFQISDFGVQIAGGQSALLSLTQNVPQVVQMFGAWGGILAGVITLMGTFALVLTKSGKGINDIVPFMGALQDEFSGLVSVIKSAVNVVLDGVNLLINNIDVLFISLSLLAGFMAAKWVTSLLVASRAGKIFNLTLRATRLHGIRAGAAMLVAKTNTLLFSSALGVLKKALVATGIGALIVLTGYLIERLLTLKQATGSWGEVIALLGQVFSQTFNQLPNILERFQLKLEASYLDMKSGWLQTLGEMTSGLSEWASDVLSVVIAVISASKSAFETLSLSFNLARTGNFKGAAAVGKNIGKIVTQSFENSIKRTEIAGSISNRFLVDSEAAARSAKGLRDQAAAINVTIPALEKMKSLLGSVDKNNFDIRSLFGGENGASTAISEEVEKINKDFKIKPEVIAPDLKPLVDQVDQGMMLIKNLGQSISQSFSKSFKGLVRGTSSFKDAMFGILDTILDKMTDLLLNPIFDAIGNSIAGGISGIFGGGIGSFLSFNGGGFTGRGARVGGMDGKGGKLAMVHPNETVIDHTQSVPFGSTSTVGKSVTMMVNNYFNGVTREEVMSDVQQSQVDMKRQIDREFPSKVRKFQKDRERGVA